MVTAFCEDGAFSLVENSNCSHASTRGLNF